MSGEKLDEASAAAFLALAYSTAALAMHVFNLSNTVPQTDDDIRRLLRRIAPMLSDQSQEVAFNCVRKALDETVLLERKTRTGH